jgi:riboflavin kinase/FMN adenylyltransferase
MARRATFQGDTLPEPIELLGGRFYDLTDGATDCSKGCVCVIGAFDGVHLGHRALIDAASDDAKRRGVPLVVVTFLPDPAFVLGQNTKSQVLLPDTERLLALSETPADALYVIGFTPELAATPYDAFMQDLLIAALEPVSIHVGKDFSLGAHGKGNVEALGVLCAAFDIDLYGHELVCEDGSVVTATRIRGLVHEGRVVEAAALMGRYRAVEGVVEHGRGEGTGFGFPTANVLVGREACLPEDGVFAGLAIVDGTAWPAAVNVGAPKTFGDADVPLLEATLLGFEGDLYGRTVKILLSEKLRGAITFESIDQLRSVVLSNVAWVRDHYGERGIDLG